LRAATQPRGRTHLLPLPGASGKPGSSRDPALERAEARGYELGTRLVDKLADQLRARGHSRTGAVCRDQRRGRSPRPAQRHVVSPGRRRSHVALETADVGTGTNTSGETAHQQPPQYGRSRPEPLPGKTMPVPSPRRAEEPDATRADLDTRSHQQRHSDEGPNFTRIRGHFRPLRSRDAASRRSSVSSRQSCEQHNSAIADAQRPPARRRYRNRGKGIARPAQPREQERSWRARTRTRRCGAIAPGHRVRWIANPSKHGHVRA